MYPWFCHVWMAKSARLNDFTTWYRIRQTDLVLIPHVILRKRLCTKDIRHVRGSENPSHIPHFSLPSSLPWHSVIIKLNHLTWMQFTHTIMWRIMWRISEGYGRDEGRDESQEMPLNKGLLLKKREGWRKKECSVSLTLKKRSHGHTCDHVTFQSELT